MTGPLRGIARSVQLAVLARPTTSIADAAAASRRGSDAGSNPPASPPGSRTLRLATAP